MPRLRVATWNIVGRPAGTDQPGRPGYTVVAGVRALAADLLAVQEVDRQLACSGHTDQPAVIAQA